MRLTRKLFFVAIIASFIGIGCNQKDDNDDDALLALLLLQGRGPNIVDRAVADGRFTVLAAALQKADLVTTLQGTGPFTVFAPTDDAFVAYIPGADDSGEAIVAINAYDEALTGTLRRILLSHVASGRFTSGILPNSLDSLNTEDDITIDFDKSKNPIEISSSSGSPKPKIIQVDIFGSNGVIHVIDRVINLFDS